MSEPIISRKDAKAKGLKFFFTGKLCKHGHVSRRYLNHSCFECIRLRYAENAETIKAAVSAYREANKEKIRAGKKDWVERNKEYVLAKQRAYKWPKKSEANRKWYAENAEQLKPIRAAWHLKNLDKVKALNSAHHAANRAMYRERDARRRAAQRKATPLWLTKEQIKEMRAIYASAPAGYDVDHIVPIAGKSVCGLHVPWNLQLLPAKTNRIKSAKFPC